MLSAKTCIGGPGRVSTVAQCLTVQAAPEIEEDSLGSYPAVVPSWGIWSQTCSDPYPCVGAVRGSGDPFHGCSEVILTSQGEGGLNEMLCVWNPQHSAWHAGGPQGLVPCFPSCQ